MKSVIISIKPKWCELIANGKKTIEVRKTKPKLDTPFKCYIYETQEKFELINQNFKAENYISTLSGIGKVIGEFVCDAIIYYNFCEVDTDVGRFEYYEWCSNLPNKVLPTLHDCLTMDEIVAYGNGKPIYGWHISDLKIYDEPKKLSEFAVEDKEAIKKCKYREATGQPEDACKNGGWIKGSYLCTIDSGMENADWCIRCKQKTLTRPPQSWYYCEEI